MRLVAVEPEALDHLDHPAGADRAAADHRPDVLHDEAEPDVRGEQVPHVLARHALLGQLERRDAERLLPDVAGVGVVAAGGHAADVGEVTRGRGPADQPALGEDRQEDSGVGVLVAAVVDVVVDDDVALVDVVPEVLDDVLQRRVRAERDDRGELGLGERVAVAVEDDRHQVADLVEDGRA
ncbi:hypothetical protein FQZ97_994930 [compost metagenome]